MSCVSYVNNRLIVWLTIVIDKLVTCLQCDNHDAVSLYTFLINTVTLFRSLLLCRLSFPWSHLMFLPSHNLIWIHRQYFCITE